MSVGSVGMLSPSGTPKFKRGTAKAKTPAIISEVPRCFFMAAKELIGNDDPALSARFALPSGGLQRSPFLVFLARLDCLPINAGAVAVLMALNSAQQPASRPPGCTPFQREFNLSNYRSGATRFV